MTSVSPILQGMLESQAAGNLKSPSLQYTASPVVPQMQSDVYEVSSKTKKAKKPLGLSLIKGGLIGGGLGFAGGVGAAHGASKFLEKTYRDCKSMEFAEKFGEFLDKIPFKKTAESIRMGLATGCGKCSDVLTTVIKSSESEAEDFTLYIASLLRENKKVAGGAFAAGAAIIGLGVAALVHKAANKSKE